MEQASGQNHLHRSASHLVRMRYPKTLTLIVAPTLRQSMIMSDRIQDFLAACPRKNARARRENPAHNYSLPKRQPNRRLTQQPPNATGLHGKPSYLRRIRFFQRRQTRLLQRPLPNAQHHRRHLHRQQHALEQRQRLLPHVPSREFSKHTVTCEDVVKAD